MTLFKYAVAALAATITFGAHAKETAFPVADQGAFVVDVPDAWAVQSKPASGAPPTIVVTPKAGEKFQILMTAFWAVSRPLPDVESLRGFVEKAAADAKRQAVEKEIDIQKLAGDHANGYYFQATDRAPGPEDYRHLTQGIYRAGGLMVTFTVLTNDGQAAVVDNALSMLRKSFHRRADAG
jgi:hypothetical protein